ncbi:hypothetical protein EXIGLDRAFT_834935 [Exidia glandulosa HHB12029]|uniref:Uncharacterized protein n=1 Tax=Exidia glandulosa HHB12029 TaxID=1314781 RepID=A0A165J934_EXIGL|nr:hypothetical protein EXIGLDRAFT_834935 [Exidia glandulosa HHB12029]
MARQLFCLLVPLFVLAVFIQGLPLDQGSGEVISESVVPRHAAKVPVAPKAHVVPHVKPVAKRPPPVVHKTSKPAASRKTPSRPVKTSAKKPTPQKSSKAKATKGIPHRGAANPSVKKPAPIKPSKPVHTTKGATPTRGKKPAAAPAKKQPVPKHTTKSAKPTKPSKPTAPVCPVKTKTTKGKVARALDAFASLFRREVDAFVGWHGTNNVTADYWRKEGYIKKPPAASAGNSGADAELGPGLYVADTVEVAISFAIGNKRLNRGTAPSLCGIFAKSPLQWRTTPKVWIPINLMGNGPALEKDRQRFIGEIVPPAQVDSTLRFSIIRPPLRANYPLFGESKSNQLLIPVPAAERFYARCITIPADLQFADLPGALGDLPPGTSLHMATFDSRRQELDIRNGACTWA